MKTFSKDPKTCSCPRCGKRRPVCYDIVRQKPDRFTVVGMVKGKKCHLPVKFYKCDKCALRWTISPDIYSMIRSLEWSVFSTACRHCGGWKKVYHSDPLHAHSCPFAIKYGYERSSIPKLFISEETAEAIRKARQKLLYEDDLGFKYDIDDAEKCKYPILRKELGERIIKAISWAGNEYMCRGLKSSVVVSNGKFDKKVGESVLTQLGINQVKSPGPALKKAAKDVAEFVKDCKGIHGDWGDLRVIGEDVFWTSGSIKK